MRTSTRLTLSALGALGIALSTLGAANAHELRGYLSAGGIDFLERQIPSYVPTHLEPPPITMEVLECFDGDMVTFTQRNTVVDITVDAFDLSLPSDGIIRVDLTLSASADGEAYLENPYLCFGTETCTDAVRVYGARAIIDFEARADDDGKLVVDLANVDLQLGQDNIEVYITDCVLDDLVNSIVGLAKEWMLDNLVVQLEEMAKEQLAPLLQEAIGGFTTFEGSLGPADYVVNVNDVAVSTSGVGIGADVDVASQYPAEPCVGPDPGEPGTHIGATPDLSAGVQSHVGLAVNLGLVDDALYHVWRVGFVCLTDAHFEEFGIDLHEVEHIIGEMLPGFPVGTEFSVEANMTAPPRVSGTAGNDATLTIGLDNFDVAIIGHLPDGSTKPIRASIGATATASVDLDQNTNAIVLKIDDVSVTRLGLGEEAVIAEIGIDVERLREVLGQHLLPHLLAGMGDIPITGSIFGVEDYYLMLRELSTTGSHIVVKVDLYRAPTDDRTAPSTSLDEVPRGPVTPDAARFRVSGSDDQIPSELLRYVVEIDGLRAEPNFMQEFLVGESGRTATYRVAVSAVDLAGNEDTSPEVAEVLVDGITPTVRLDGPGIREVASGDPDAISWYAEDDHTTAGQLRATVSLYKAVDPTDLLTAELVGEAPVDQGAATANVSFPEAGVYRVVVTVRDEAGNGASSSIIYSITGESATGCACNQSGTPSGSAGLILLALGAILMRRRRA